MKRHAEREARYFEAAIRRVLFVLGDKPTLHEIRDAVCEAFRIETNDIIKQSRWNIDRMARQAVMALAWRLTDRSLVKIASVLGAVDHTSVLHANRKYADVIERVMGPEEVAKKPRRLTKKELEADTLYMALGRLIKWSVEEALSHTEDIFPEWSVERGTGRLLDLRRRGYAESEKIENELYWRATPAGRRAFQKMTWEREDAQYEESPSPSSQTRRTEVRAPKEHADHHAITN